MVLCMTIVNTIKKNMLSFIITVVVIAWMVFLVLMVGLANRTVQFVDVIPAANGVDVSSQYSSDIPLLRYFLEPFIGFVFSIVSDPLDAIVSVLLFYVIIRLALFALDNTILHGSRKKEVVFAYFKDTLDYFEKWMLISLIISVIALGVGFLIFGFMYINSMFQYHILIAIYIGIGLLAYKGGGHLIRFLLPRMSPKPLNLEKVPENRSIVDKLKTRPLQEFWYFIQFTLVFLVTSFTLLNIRFPTQHITPTVPLEEDEILLDMHVHTTMSDGYLMPHDRVLWYMEQGFSAAGFSDHDNVRGAHLAQAFVNLFNLDFTVITAEEYTCQSFDNAAPYGMHLNIYGLEEGIIPTGPLRREDVFGKSLNVEHMIKYVKNHSGFVIVNHYRSTPGYPYTYKQLMEWGVDGFEVINGGSYDQRYKDIREFCLRPENAGRLALLANTDKHTNDEANCFMKIKLDDPNDITAASIFAALKKNEHEAVYIDRSTKYVNLPSNIDDYFSLFEDMVNYFLNSDKLLVVSWMVWSGAAYILSIFLIQRIKKSDIGNIDIYKTQTAKAS